MHESLSIIMAITRKRESCWYSLSLSPTFYPSVIGSSPCLCTEWLSEIADLVIKFLLFHLPFFVIFPLWLLFVREKEMGNREGGRKGGRRVFVWLNASEESVKGRKCNVDLFEISFDEDGELLLRVYLLYHWVFVFAFCHFLWTLLDWRVIFKFLFLLGCDMLFCTRRSRFTNSNSTAEKCPSFLCCFDSLNLAEKSQMKRKRWSEKPDRFTSVMVLYIWLSVFSLTNSYDFFLLNTNNYDIWW